jgi:hypothetical protein
MTQSNLVFLVDDSADFHFLVQTVFEHFLTPYQLRVFNTGESLARHALRTQERPGLIL